MVFKRAFPKRRPLRKFRKSRAKKSSRALVTKPQLYRAINRNIETKIATNQYTITAFNSGISATGDFITLLPSITVSGANYGRVGNKIRPIKMIIRGYIVYDSTSLGADNDARMLGARMFVLQDKGIRCYTDQNTSNISYNVLNNGSSSTIYGGSAMSWILPANHDQFKIYADKKFKLLKPYGYTNNTTPSSTNAILAMNNTLFHPFTVVLNQKQLPSVLTYDSNESVNYPTNFAPYIALGYSDLLNATPDVTGTQLSMEFVCELHYKDA